MEPLFSANIAYLLVIGFGVLWLFFGYLWSRKIKTSDDFTVAGRQVGLAIGSATVMATWCTASTVLAAPELGYQAGLWGMIGYGLGGLGVIMFGPIAQRIKTLMPTGVTSGDFMRTRYGEGTWGLYMVLSNVYNLAFLVTQAMGGGLILNLIFGIPYHFGMMFIVAVCIVYTMLGGLKAVVGTDFIQSLMIMASIVIVIPIAITKLGFGELYSGVLTNMPDRLDMIKPLGLMYAFNSAVFSLGEIFHSNLWWVRAHAMRDDVVRRGWTYGGLMWMSIPVLAGSAGLIAIATGLDFPHVNMIIPMIAVDALGGIGGFLIILVVLGAIYSSLDSLLAGTSSLLAEDIYRAKINPSASDNKMQWINRLLIVGIGVVTAAFAWFEPATMGEIIFFSAAMVCAMIWPIVFGLFSERPSKISAIASMIAGSAAGVYVATTVSPFGAAVAAAITALPVFILFTKLFPDDFDWSRFSKADQEVIRK